MENNLKIFKDAGLDVLINDGLFKDEVGNLGDRQVTNTLLAVQDKDGEKTLVTIQKSDLTFKNWIKSFFFSDSPFKKDYHLENVVDYTKNKLHEVLNKADQTEEYKKLKSFSEKIAYLKVKESLSDDDLKVLNNIYHIANRAYFYDHDKVGLFDAVSKTINLKNEKNKNSSITVYVGGSLAPQSIKNDFKWNPMMNTRFIALEALKQGEINTFMPLKDLHVQLGFEKELAGIPQKLNEIIKEENLVTNGLAACIKFVKYSKGDYIDECLVAYQNNSQLFGKYESNIKIEILKKLHDKAQQVPYEKLTIDEMIQFIDNKPEMFERIPEKFHEQIINKNPQLLTLSEDFTKKKLKNFNSYSLESQKNILKFFINENIIKQLMPLACENAQIYIIQEFGDQFVEVGKLDQELFKGFSNLAFELNLYHKSHIYLGTIQRENILWDNKQKKMILSGFDKVKKVTQSTDCTLQFPFTSNYMCANDIFKLNSTVEDKNVEEYRGIREKMDVFALAVSMFAISTGGDLPCTYSERGFATDRMSIETIIEKLKDRLGDTEKTKRLAVHIYLSLDPDHTERPTSSDFYQVMNQIATM